MKRFIPLAAIVIIAFLSVFCLLLFTRVINPFPETHTYKTSESARNAILAAGVDLPENAYNLEYYGSGWQEYKRWIAFSASNEDIEQIIAKLVAKHPRAQDSGETDWIPPRPEGLDVGNWWPTSNSGLEVVKGELFWIGHDPVHQRLYYYNYSI